jgi:hypothetical protein
MTYPSIEKDFSNHVLGDSQMMQEGIFGPLRPIITVRRYGSNYDNLICDLIG